MTRTSNGGRYERGIRELRGNGGSGIFFTTSMSKTGSSIDSSRQLQWSGDLARARQAETELAKGSASGSGVGGGGGQERAGRGAEQGAGGGKKWDALGLMGAHFS